ncbi:MAG: hypothetical protein ACRDNZ_11130 [Streptosporangiaceae bacterium]
MTRHFSTEKLARFGAGDLRAAAARRVGAHLDRCTTCQAEADALAELPALLARTELPRIPSHLAARIDAALATESAHRAAGSPALRPGRAHGPQRAHGAQRQSGSQHRRSRSPAPGRAILVTAAVVAIIGGGSYGLVRGLAGAGGGTSAAASGSRSAAGSAAVAPPQSNASRFSSARPGAGAAGGSGASGVRPGAVRALAFGPLERYSYAGHAGHFTPVRTDTDYVAVRLGQQASAALVRVQGAAAGRLGGPGSPQVGSPRVGSPYPGREGPASEFSATALASLPGCVGRVAAGQAVLLVDLASFQGSPATIIVTAPPGSTVASQVWVVGPGCSRSDSDVLAHQLLP